MIPRLRSLVLLLAGCVLLFPASTLFAQGEQSAVGPLIKLLDSGRLPPERQEAIVGVVCQRGNSSDLTFIFNKATDPKGYQGQLQLTALQGLKQAALTRKVNPEGDLSPLGQLIQPEKLTENTATQIAAIQLAGLWKVEGLSTKLQQIVLSGKGSQTLQQSALDSLVEIGGEPALKTLQQLVSADQPVAQRFRGAAALSNIKLNEAAEEAAKALKAANETADPSEMIATFLDQQNGANALASAIGANPPEKAVALKVLRYIYSIGRTDSVLVNTLSEAAGLDAEPKPMTKEEIVQLEQDVLSKGNAAHGEEIFRRMELSCMKCHAVSKGGGQVGPDLSAVGVSSPPDYIIRSILNPNETIKEAYLTRIFVTVDGKIHQGIVIDRDEDRVILKDATGREKIIPVDDIDDEAEGSSLMPQGLTKFLTREELVDLVRFLSELGKPEGNYPIRSRSTVQRWRVLTEVPEDLPELNTEEAIISKLLETEPVQWESAYSTVNGVLPLEELTLRLGQKVLYLQAEVEVTEAGEVGLKLTNPEGVTAWVEDNSFEGQSEFSLELTPGIHRLTLRVDTTARTKPTLEAEFVPLEGSSAEFTVVDGQ